MPDAYIGLGSNLDRPYWQIQHAIQRLKKLPQTRLISHASIYRSLALGNASHPDYLNTVARIRTALKPLALLDCLQAIERRNARRKIAGRRWQPRTIDLDILLYGNQSIQHPRLSVPHSEMEQRDFVMLPLLEILPANARIPRGESVADWGKSWSGKELPTVQGAGYR